jgi:hypothetical protein
VSRDIAILGRTGSKKEPEPQPASQAAPVDWDQFAAEEAAEMEKPPGQRWIVPGR